MNRKRIGNKTALFQAKIEERAKLIGFDLVGFSPARIAPKYLEVFDRWLDDGNEGQMSYMRKIEKRRDLRKILPGAKSVIVLGTNYYRPQAKLKANYGKVARYAYGRDYHKIIGKKLKQLEKFIQELESDRAIIRETPGTSVAPHSCSTPVTPASTPITKSYIDTGPILERALAEQAGLGRIGKNSCLITKEFGSWIFLSEIITTVGLVSKHCLPRKAGILPLSRWSDPAQPPANVCGNCTRCIDACPTGAIIAPGVIDTRLCISYLTIENKDKIPPKLAKIIKKTKRIYGCDICQEVCPHNEARQKSIKAASANPIHRALTLPRIAGSQLSAKKIASIKNDEQFLQAFAGSPLMRAKKEGLKRNVEILTLKGQK